MQFSLPNGPETGIESQFAGIRRIGSHQTDSVETGERKLVSKTSIASHDLLHFFVQWLRRPGELGALTPSSPALARTLAARAGRDRPGWVVELGPGNGVVTRALLDAGIDPGRLVLVERNASFCRLLRERFPDVRVIEGDACHLGDLLAEAHIAPVANVMSGLPLLSMSRDQRRAVLAQIAGVLEPQGVLVQYTYSPGAPVSEDLQQELGLAGKRTDWVVANVPPAAVWRYCRQDRANTA